MMSHAVSIENLEWPASGLRDRAVLDLTADQEQEQDAEYGVHPHESKKRKEPVAGRDPFRISVRGSHQTLDQPRLTTDLRGDPSRGVGDVGKGRAQQEDPQHPVSVEQLAAP